MRHLIRRLWRLLRNIKVFESFFLALPILALIVAVISISFQEPKEVSIEVNFSPNGGAMEAVVREVDAAKKSILIQAYSFTSPLLGPSLIAAHKRGVKVEIILDKENLGNPNSLLRPLHEEGIPIYLDDKHTIAHNKIVIIDSSTVITGSMNLTKAGNDSNAENSLIIKNDNSLSARYISNWQLHQSHSKPFSP